MIYILSIIAVFAATGLILTLHEIFQFIQKKYQTLKNIQNENHYQQPSAD